MEVKEGLPGVELRGTAIRTDAAVAEGDAKDRLAGKLMVEEDSSVATPGSSAAVEVFGLEGCGIL